MNKAQEREDDPMIWRKSDWLMVLGGRESRPHWGSGQRKSNCSWET
jgi:hypothetical protein